MLSAKSQSLAETVCISILAFAIALYLCASVRQVDRELKQSSDWRTYFAKDSMHYYVIGQAFAAGDFSMSYEKGWPYRQPLFPLLVAGVTKVTGGNLFAIRLINAGVIIVATISLFLILRRFWTESVSPALISTVFILSPFTYDQSIHGLATEPLHLFLLICAIACFLRYTASPHWRYLLLLAFVLGLDYLDRINGLFVAFSAIAVLICFACSRQFLRLKQVWAPIMRQHADTPIRRNTDTQGTVSWRSFLIAALILVIVTAPSWFSRFYYFGNPFYHGAIQNFLWGDSYLGSMDSPRMLTAGDYFASHSLLDAVSRFLLGCWKVFFIIPIDRERLPLLYFSALAGIWLAWRQRRAPYLWLLLFYLLQMVPLAWTQPVNTTARIPYASTQPFELFFAALFLHWLWAKIQPDASPGSTSAVSPLAFRR
jgi:hypothetical protein